MVSQENALRQTLEFISQSQNKAYKLLLYSESPSRSFFPANLIIKILEHVRENKTKIPTCPAFVYFPTLNV